ncbi:MAG: hypothetical protein KA735_11435 [Burkholderiaceae bacterium]|nr:hypothetical protein [Burkholderiaceae bacterium]
MKSNTKYITRLATNQRGAVAPLFLMTAVLILGATFGGIDLIRYSVAQGRLQSALDGATLSAGRNLASLTANPSDIEVGQWRDDAYAYFRSNLPNGFLDSNIEAEDLSIEYTDEKAGGYTTGQNIKMSVKGDLPLISVGFLNIASMPIHASNQAVRRIRSDLELVMALDNTGSMGWGYGGSSDTSLPKRMDSLKDAATQLSAMVLGASEASGVPGRVFIGLVPFADTVNVGNVGRTRGWLQPTPPEQVNFVNNLWMGCIAEPVWTGTNLPAEVFSPTAGFQALRMTLRTIVERGDVGLQKDDMGNGNNKKPQYQQIMPSNPSQPQPKAFTLTPQTKAERFFGVWRSDTTTNRDKKDPAFYIYSAANPSNCKASRRVFFLNDDLSSIKSAINNMESSGSTIIPTGLLWAWRMLHPDWRGTSGWGDTAMPRDPEPKVLSKVIVLLTDGENAPSTSSGSDSAERLLGLSMKFDIQTCEDPGFSSACQLKEGSYSTTSVSNTSQRAMNSLRMRDPSLPADPSKPSNWTDGQSNSIGWGNNSDINQASVDDYLKALCAKVKLDGNGIKVYTVTVGNLDTSTISLMKGCSNGDAYYYQANKPEELTAAFASIAGALTELRLTQ